MARYGKEHNTWAKLPLKTNKKNMRLCIGVEN
jgi:hypothetical protein